MYLIKHHLGKTISVKCEGKAIPVAGYGGYRVVGHQGFHILQTVSSQIVLRLSALRPGHLPFTPSGFPGPHSYQKLSQLQGCNAAGKIR
jgi:hypothetical protein